MRAQMRLRPPVMDQSIAPCAAPTPHGTARSMLPLGADSYGAPAPATGLLVRVPIWASQGPRLPAWGSLYPPRRAIRMGAVVPLLPSDTTIGGEWIDRSDFYLGPPVLENSDFYLGPPVRVPRERLGPGPWRWWRRRYVGPGEVPPVRRASRMGAHCWGRLYPPREAIRGPFLSPPYHIGLGDDVAPGAPATSVTYPDILTSMDQVAVPALEPTDVWVPPGLAPMYGVAPPIGAPVAPTFPVFTSPGITTPPRYDGEPASTLTPTGPVMFGPFTQTQWLYGAGAALGLVLLLSLTKRRR